MNKYFPPDWDPSQGTAHQHHKNKKRGEASKRDDSYMLLEGDIQELEVAEAKEDVQVSFGRKKARIELPYNVWCEGCGRHIAKNVRVNSEKQQVGNYFRTAVWEFTFTCPSCPQVIVMRSDPQNQTYIMQSGARAQKHHQEEETPKEEVNPFAVLERKVELEKEVKQVGPRLEILKQVGDVTRKDDFGSNRAVRAEHREIRKRERREVQKAKSLSDRYALSGLSIGPENAADKAVASAVPFSLSDPLNKVKRQDIFGKKSDGRLFKKSDGKGSLLDALDFCK